MKNPSHPRTDWQDLKALFLRYLRPYWVQVVLLLLGYFLLTSLTAIHPLLMSPILDLAMGVEQAVEVAPLELSLTNLDLNNISQYFSAWLRLNQFSPWQTVLVLALVYLAVALLIYALEFGSYLLGIWIRVQSGRGMQRTLFEHILTHSLDFFHSMRTGEIISRLDKDTTAAVAGLEAIAKNIIIAPLFILFYGALLLRTNARLTLFILLAGLLHYALTQAIRNPIRNRVKDQFNIMADTSAYFQEIVSGIRVVKSFVSEAYETLRLKDIMQRLVDINFRFGVWKHIDEPVSKSINALTNVAILLLTANELFSGRLNVTGFLLYLYVGRAILDPLKTLTQTYNAIQITLSSGERVRELLAQLPTIVSGDQPVAEFRESLKLDGVSFRYATLEDVVLEDISVDIRRGEIVALVGPSGAGKSTLTDLLLRFYDPQAGRITLDGRDLADLNLADYRRLFGVVAQENYLFNASVAENIAYAFPNASHEQIVQAAKIANAHEFIEEMPEGYNTLVGDRGVRLSGGQRQRVAIARAVVRQPQILILDEATSALDSVSEKLVQDAIDRVIHNTTAVVIAHRLSTVRGADKIVVMERGRVVDIGKHDELLARCELYQYLCELQFGVEPPPAA